MKETPECLFEKFLKSSTCKETQHAFHLLCKELNLQYPPPRNAAYDHVTFYARIKKLLGTYWKAQSLFAKLDKKYNDDANFVSRKSSREKDRAAKDFNVLIIGAGPCGLRTAILTSLLGAKTVVVEKRDSYSRNNVLHLWPFTIEDLKALGAKKYNGRFCSGAIDHVSIRQLQLILMKSALLFGVEIHVNTGFCDLIEPNTETATAWKAKIDPESSPVSDFEFHMIVGADGRKNTLKGFDKKEFRGSLAIGITVNFINKHTREEAQCQEISGINFIYRQEFFRELNRKYNIDLENIVYYKDDTHYFVMTARKVSLVARGVFRKSLDDPRELVHNNNIDKKALLEYALDAVNFSTENKLPKLEVAINNYGLPDIALFDFTSMKSALNSTMFREVNGVKLFAAIVGDGLIEPFWPKGTGIAKGFLAAFDTSWMLKQWALGKTQQKAGEDPIELSLLAEREALYRILAQVESNNLVQNYSKFSIDPRTRYSMVPSKLPLGKIKKYYVTDGKPVEPQECADSAMLAVESAKVPSRLTRNVSFVRSNKLQQWCERVLRDSGADLNVMDMSSSWKNGLALCSIINYYRPDILELDNLEPGNAEYNNQLAFDVAEEYLGITPIMSGKEMAECQIVDDLVMVTYISQFYEILKNEMPVKPVSRVSDIIATPPEDRLPKTKKKSPLGLLVRISQQFKRKSVQRGSTQEYDVDGKDSKRRKGEVAQSTSGVRLTKVLPTIIDEDKENTVVKRAKADNSVLGVRKNTSNRISAIGLQLISQWEQNSDVRPVRQRSSGSSSVCYFCGKTVYIVERLSVEGLFFHRECFKCSHCETPLRSMNYKRDSDSGKFFCGVHFFSNGEESISTGSFKAKSPTTPEVHIDGSITSENTDPDQAYVPLTPPDALNLSVPTIENGQVVMRKDLTPSRTDMQKMALSLFNYPKEVGEDFLYKHNMRCSHNSDTDSMGYTSESEAEELDEIADEVMGLRNHSVQEVLSEYHNRGDPNVSRLSESAFLSSESEGDEDVSSLSSTTADDTVASVQAPDKAEVESREDEVSLSSASSDEPEVYEIFLSDVELDADCDNDKTDMEKTDKGLSNDMDLGSKQSVNEIETGFSKHEERAPVVYLRRDTLEAAEDHIHNNPIHDESKYLSSSSSESCEEKAEELEIEVEEEDIEKNPISDEPKYLSSVSSEYADEEHMQLEKKEERELSSESSDGESDIEADCGTGTDFHSPTPTSSNHLENDTSVWVSNLETGDMLESSFPDAVSPVSSEDNNSLLGKTESQVEAAGFEKDDDDHPSEYLVASTPKLSRTVSSEDNNHLVRKGESQVEATDFEMNDDDHPSEALVASTPKLSRTLSDSDDIFLTPCADRTEFDSFYTVKSNQSVDQAISFDLGSGDATLDSTLTSDTVDSCVLADSFSSETSNRSGTGRKLPDTPNTNKSLTRRRLPVIPHLEVLSPTGSEVSQRQQHRIATKLKKHEDRVLERIRKMKLGISVEEKSEDTKEEMPVNEEKDDFVNHVPLLIRRRNNALLKKKHKRDREYDNKKGTFLFGLKKKNQKKKLPISPAPAEPPIMSSTNRSSRKPLSSYTKEEIDNRVSYRVRVAAQRLAKEAERKRMARALVIQGQLEEVDAKQKQLEERGVKLEKLLRDQKTEGVQQRDSSLHMHEWFKMVQEKNALLRYENELMIYQRELQLEDRQSRLQQELRERMAMNDSEKTDEELTKERVILSEMMKVVEQRDQLVALLDEHRVQDNEENFDIEQVLMQKFLKNSINAGSPPISSL